VPGPGAFPLGIGVSLMVLSVCLAVQSLRGGMQKSESDTIAERWGMLRVLAVCGLVALYIFALPIVGFTLDTALLMTALYAVGSGRLGIREIAAALLTTGATYALFVAILEVRLPQGSLWRF
jgi:putative tricarboxylic transport membrane protein